MRVTQQDIAKQSGVSQATVSRVLANDPRVESTIREKVMAVIEANNYSPDVRARSLRKKQSYLIGLVLRRGLGRLHGDPFFNTLVAEIVDCLAGTPYHLCVEIATDEADQNHIYDEMLRTRRVDGLILVESEPSDDRIERLQEDQFPFVLIGNASFMSGINWVDNDNILAGQIAAEHLLQQGYQKICMLAGPANLTVTQDRVAGYCSALAKAGRNANVHYSDFGQAAAYKAAMEILNEKARPDAVIAMDDFMAAGVVEAARNRGIHIPQDLGVVGFNDSFLCSLIAYGLTSVDLKIREMVRWSIARLLEVVEDEHEIMPKHRLMPCELVVRGSSSKKGRVALG